MEDLTLRARDSVQVFENSFVKENISLFSCPSCRGDLRFDFNSVACSDCGEMFSREDGLYKFFWPNDWGDGISDVTQDIKRFYEETPFPNYDQLDDPARLRANARKSWFAKQLDDHIPFNSRILECGCGTGQLTNFLSLSNRIVIGADLCLNSLRLANNFREAHGLRRALFCQMNLFRPCFKEEVFDLVISNGVLHHTSDPKRGFHGISKLVKPGGMIVIGLYHRYGRIATDIRRVLFNLSGDRLKLLDSRVVNDQIDKVRRETWFLDQYKNPHESKHTIREVLTWFKEAGFEFVSSIPKNTLFSPISADESIFAQDTLGNTAEQTLNEIMMMFTNAREGGFFTVIGRKPKA